MHAFVNSIWYRLTAGIVAGYLAVQLHEVFKWLFSETVALSWPFLIIQVLLSFMLGFGVGQIANHIRSYINKR
jgi:hypothetical protein